MRFLRHFMSFFDRLGTLLVRPGDALGDAAAGRWAAFSDASILFVVGLLLVYAREVVAGLIVMNDVGVREGLASIYWNLQSRVTLDVLAFLAVGFVMVLPLRITNRLSFERALHLAAACWIPLWLIRAAGHGVRLYDEQPLAVFPGSLEWLLGGAASVTLIVWGYAIALRGDGDLPRQGERA